MKYAIISDIHANLEAFTTVLDRCKAEGVDKYICAGDIVGYNANPRECLELVQQLDLVGVVRGNHDEYVANNEEELVGFNPHAKTAVVWTKQQLTEQQREWLGKLPLKNIIRQTNITVVHATLDSPESWGYVFDIHQATDNFSYQFTQLCFCGHSHVPIAFSKRAVTLGQTGKAIEEVDSWKTNPSNPSAEIVISLQPGWKYLINIGSVGQPRNGDPRASFAIYDSEKKTVRRYCLEYNIAAAQEKIRAAGLPERLAIRLNRGN